MTEATRVWSDGEDLAQALKKSFRGWSERFKRGGGAYGAVSLDAVEWARSIIGSREITGADSFDDTQEGFAQRILVYEKIIRKCIVTGKADSAARFAFEMGVVCCTLEMKQSWESLLVPAKKIREGSRRAAIAKSKSDRDAELAKRWANAKKSRPGLTQKQMAHEENMQLSAYSKAIARGRKILEARKIGRSV